MAAPFRTHVAKTAITAAFALAACVSLLGPARAQVAQAAQAKPAPAPGSSVNGAAERHDQPTAIRVIPPNRGHRERLGGRVEIQTLIVHPSITTVEFFLDGRQTMRVRRLRQPRPPHDGGTAESPAASPADQRADRWPALHDRALHEYFALGRTAQGGVRPDPGRSAAPVRTHLLQRPTVRRRHRAGGPSDPAGAPARNP